MSLQLNDFVFPPKTRKTVCVMTWAGMAACVIVTIMWIAAACFPQIDIAGSWLIAAFFGVLSFLSAYNMYRSLQVIYLSYAISGNSVSNQAFGIEHFIDLSSSHYFQILEVPLYIPKGPVLQLHFIAVYCDAVTPIPIRGNGGMRSVSRLIKAGAVLLPYQEDILQWLAMYSEDKTAFIPYKEYQTVPRKGFLVDPMEW